MLGDTQHSVVGTWSDPTDNLLLVKRREGNVCSPSSFSYTWAALHAESADRRYWEAAAELKADSSSPRGCWRAPAGVLCPSDKVQGPASSDQQPARPPSPMTLLSSEMRLLAFYSDFVK